jgi:hypothetical protein
VSVKKKSRTPATPLADVASGSKNPCRLRGRTPETDGHHCEAVSGLFVLFFLAPLRYAYCGLHCMHNNDAYGR